MCIAGVGIAEEVAGGRDAGPRGPADGDETQAHSGVDHRQRTAGVVEEGTFSPSTKLFTPSYHELLNTVDNLCLQINTLHSCSLWYLIYNNKTQARFKC